MGLWAIWIITESPELWIPNKTMLNFNSKSATCSLLFCLSYHVAETVDLILIKYKSLIIHHLLTIVIIIEALYRGTEMGFAVWLLAGQGQNVFLITRLLQIIEGVDKSSTKYMINCYINIVSFFFIKIVLYVWINYLFITQTNLILISCFLFFFVNPINIQKFIIILRKDFFNKPSENLRKSESLQKLVQENEEKAVLRKQICSKFKGSNFEGHDMNMNIM